MCMFTGPVQAVSATQIFARGTHDGRQFLVYSMNYKAGEDLAMVLPLPVPPASAANSVRFIDLTDYGDFFTDVETGYDAWMAKGLLLSGPLGGAPPLKVVQVGSFEASFVPAVADFARLDPRFRMPDGVWDKLPKYRFYGFAVFKLRKDAQRVHPMAFSFPRKDPERLFFPTVHVHDGNVDAIAPFDHRLYCQSVKSLGGTYWHQSYKPAASFMEIERAQGIVDGDAHCYRLEIRGALKNEDTLV